MSCVAYVIMCVFFFKQKTAYEMRISDWSSDVCSSDLRQGQHPSDQFAGAAGLHQGGSQSLDVRGQLLGFGAQPQLLVIRQDGDRTDRARQPRIPVDAPAVRVYPRLRQQTGMRRTAPTADH